MNIRKLYYLHHKIAFLKVRYLLIPAIVFALLSIYGLRANYSKMTELRQAVYTADQTNGNVEKALTELRKHVHGHMNTNLTSGSNPIKPPIQLKSRYEKLVSAEQERVKRLNTQVTAQAEQICAAQHPQPGFNAPRVACIQEYVRTNGAKARTIPDQLYKFDFVSPRWSPDMAGISLILSGLFFILATSRIVLEYYFKRQLH